MAYWRIDRTGVVFILFWLICASSASAQTLDGPVTHVRDGDTIEVTGIPVRLRGINCEELGSPRGRQALELMTQLVRDKKATCVLNGERTGDRVVGWCAVDGVDLGDTLVRNGICGRCDRYDTERRYVDAQRAAGQWSGRVPGYCK